MHGFAGRIYRSPEFGVITAVLVIGGVFTALAPRFLTLASIGGILTVAAELGLVTCGIAFLMISREFDLSVGSVLALTAMIFALCARAGIPPVGAMLIALCCAGVVGFINGIMVVKSGVPSFIITLGSQMLWRGVVLAVTAGFPITFRGDSALWAVLSGRYADRLRVSAFWLLGVAIVLWFVLSKTRYGNWVFGTGGGEEAARIQGIPTKRVKVTNFVICSLLAGFAGCVQFARFHSIDPMRGQGLELEAIAAAVIGGTLMTGGYGTIIGALMGALLFGMVRSGLVMAGASPYYYQAFIGAVLITAAVVNLRLKRWLAP